MTALRRSDSGPDRIVDYDPERARRTLSGGVLLFRWVALSWMVALNITHPDPLRRQALAWVGLGAAGLWTVFLTVNRGEERPSALFGQLLGDLTLSVGLILISGLVVFPGQVSGPRLFYATAYPLSTALAWGAARGLRGALEAAAVLSVALVLSRPLNGIPIPSLSTGQWLSLVNGLVNYLLAGGVAGVVANHLDRSAALLRATIDDAILSRERAARLAERESLARAIHDSVLQALSRISVRAKELSGQAAVPGPEVLGLGDMAREQERALRALVVRERVEVPAGAASLQEALERAARAITAIPVSVSSVGPIVVPSRYSEEIEAAVRQALENVVEHAGCSHAWVFAHIEDGWVTVSIRDDGCGFVYDETRLHQEGKAGMLKSMKGRIEDLGGRMSVETAPGAGTVVQFRVPARVEEVRS